MPNFSTTPAPVSPPPVRFVCSSFEQVHRGGINNISKCRLGQGEGWCDDRGISSGKRGRLLVGWG